MCRRQSGRRPHLDRRPLLGYSGGIQIRVPHEFQAAAALVGPIIDVGERHCAQVEQLPCLNRPSDIDVEAPSTQLTQPLTPGLGRAYSDSFWGFSA